MISLGSLGGNGSNANFFGGGSWSAASYSADGTPWFTQEQPEYFHVEIPHGRKLPTSARTSVGNQPARKKAYDFSVDMGLDADDGRSFIHGVVDAIDEEDAHDEKLVQADDRFRFFNDRSNFRSQRARCFSSGRQFPALISERLLPSFRLVHDAKQSSFDAVTPSGPTGGKSILTAPTMSHCRKKTPKRKPPAHLPFVPGGNQQQRERSPEFATDSQTDSYEAARQAARDEVSKGRTKWIGGAFKPSSAKPGSRGNLTSQGSSRSALSSQSSSRHLSGRRLPRLRGAHVDGDGAGLGGATSSSGGAAMDGTNVAGAVEGNYRRLSPPETIEVEPAIVEDRSARSPRREIGRSPTAELASYEIGLARRGGIATTEPARDHASNDGDGAIPVSSPIDANDLVGSLMQQNAARVKAEAQRQESERYCGNVFRRMAVGGRLPRSEIGAALEQLGVKRATDAWIDELYEELGHEGDSESLSCANFIVFRETYLARQQQAYKSAFEACDMDKSGVVDLTELKDLLKSFEIEPMAHVLAEVVQEVDQDGDGGLNFDEFQDVMDILRAREGFIKSERDDYIDLFNRIGASHVGSMKVTDVPLAMSWLGLKLGEAKLTEILKDIDQDGSGQIDEKEWMTFLRVFRDSSIKSVKDAMATQDIDGDGTITFKEIDRCLRAIGYVPEPGVAHECAAAVGVSVDDDDIDLSEIWMLLMEFIKREGLSDAELITLNTCFARFDKENEGNIMNSKIGKLIRSMGYTLSFTVQQDLLLKVDIDGSGQVDRREFRKLVRLIRERDIQTYRVAFQEASAMERSTPKLERASTKLPAGFQFTRQVQGKTLTILQARHALRRVGCVDAEGVVAAILPEDRVDGHSIDFYGFCHAASRSRKQAREHFMLNGGFAKAEIEEIRCSFERYDEDGSGSVSGKETIKLLEQEFPLLFNDPILRPEIVKLLQEADEDGNGSLDFSDFLKVMRLIKDLQEQLRIEKELKAVSETRFSPSEVEEFRQLFQTTSNGAGEIGFDPVRELLACIVPMGAKHTDELQTIFTKKAANQCVADGSKDLLDFPEFLWLMRELLDNNWANIADRTSQMVEKA